MERRRFLSAAAGAVASLPIISCNSGNKSANEEELIKKYDKLRM